MKKKLKRQAAALLTVFILGILGCVFLIMKNAVLGSALIIVWTMVIYCFFLVIKRKRDEMELPDEPREE